MTDTRISLTADDRETLRHMFNYIEGNLNEALGKYQSSLERFSLGLARAKVMRLKDKLLPTKEKPNV